MVALILVCVTPCGLAQQTNASDAPVRKEVRGYAKGWSEEKRLHTVQSLQWFYPAVAAQGDNVYVGYVQGTLNLLVSHDAGKTWAPPVVLSGDLEINSAPALTVLGDRVIVVWPAMAETGNILSLQLHTVHSLDAGRTWSAPSRITQNIDDCLSPRLLPLETGLILVWQQTPAESTLGSVSLKQRADWSPDSIEAGITKFETGSVERDGYSFRVTIASSFYSRADNAFTPARRIQEIFAKQMPNVFQVYGPEKEGIFLTFNVDMDVKTLLSTDQGRSWTPHFAGTRYFDSRKQMSVVSSPEGRRAVWIQRIPYQSLPITLQDTLDGPPKILTPPYFVRATPSLALSDVMTHVVWGAGQEESSWIAYMRTDDVRPTTRITAPTSPEIIGPMIRFEWTGDDNISEAARLTYSYTYGDRPWSPFNKAPFTEIETPPDGEFTFRVRAADVAGNVQEPPAAFTFNSFGAAPDTEILGIRLEPTVMKRIDSFGGKPPTLKQRKCRVLFSGKDNTQRSNELMYSVQLDSGDWSEFVSDRSYEFQKLANGSHTLRVRAKDARGNIDATPAELAVNVEVDLEVRLVQTPPAFTNEEAVTISWEGIDNSGENATFLFFYRLDDGEPQALGSDTQTVLTELEEKQHTFSVWAVDPAGNRTGEESCSFIMDRTPPQTIAYFEHQWSPSGGFPIVILEGADPPVGDARETRPVRLFQYHLGDGQWEEASLPGGREWVVSRPIPFYAWGYKVAVRAVDTSGNVDPAPAVVDLTLLHRYTTMTYGIVGGVAALVVIILLWLLSRRRSRRRPVIPAESALDAYSAGSDEETAGTAEEKTEEKSDSSFGY